MSDPHVKQANTSKKKIHTVFLMMLNWLRSVGAACGFIIKDSITLYTVEHSSPRPLKHMAFVYLLYKASLKSRVLTILYIE